MQVKTSLHPRNKHRTQYDFKKLIESAPTLAPFVRINKYGKESINFFNPQAVKALNRALLIRYYGMIEWDIPAGYLCPPIPGRADYIHYIADLLADSHAGRLPVGPHITCLDIGVGANCVYPIIGRKEYAWSFIGTDIDPVAIKVVKQLIIANPILSKHLKIRQQPNTSHIFQSVLSQEEFIDVVICNPPFHRSAEEARAGSARKLQNLKGKKVKKITLNFGGQSNELWCEGGEEQFVKNMILESKSFASSCYWFTTLLSKQSHLKKAYQLLSKVSAKKVQTIQMSQGNKSSRILAWTFLSDKQRKKWREYKWDQGKV